MSKEYDLTVYSNGLVHCSVCTNAPKKEVEPTVNEHNPTGLDSGWKISTDKTFSSGEPNPATCEQKPKTHKHYLMVC